MKKPKIGNKKLIYEYVTMFIISLLLGVFAVYSELFEKINSFSRKYEEFELDELFSFLIVVSSISIFFTIRRILDLRREMKRRFEAENLLKQTNSELSVRLNEIKTLQGIIPICANCKKIRDEEGYWHQVENYVSTHSKAVFSHSLCSECVEKLYPDLKRKKNSFIL